VGKTICVWLVDCGVPTNAQTLESGTLRGREKGKKRKSRKVTRRNSPKRETVEGKKKLNARMAIVETRRQEQGGQRQGGN